MANVFVRHGGIHDVAHRHLGDAITASHVIDDPMGLGVLVNLHLDLNHQAAYQLEAADVELVDEVELAEVAGDAPSAGVGGGVVILVLFFLVVVGKVVDVALAIVIDVVESYVVLFLASPKILLVASLGKSGKNRALPLLIS